ncbi:Mobile element protein [Candidatus Enterovibrio escicola]|uniref:Mobile element protein n=1 Tax=Candidatus Enterovibrio escicola TaxID=1927127 RepID=A0A2A5T0M5_9GAMM|nr:Mobile element protein [Candidatus Enterovibrio escacola]
MPSGVKQRNKPSRLLVSEVMTIVIAFHQSGYRDFKTYYIHFICHYLINKFPELVSYTRMLKLMQGILVSLCSYLTHRQRLPLLIRLSYRFFTPVHSQISGF